MAKATSKKTAGKKPSKKPAKSRRLKKVDSRERKTIRTTEQRNAERLLEIHGANLRYIGSWEHWVIWDGKRFKLDEDGAAKRAMSDVVRHLAAEAEHEIVEAEKALKDDMKRFGVQSDVLAERVKTAKNYLAWCRTSQNNRALESTLSLASSFPDIALLHSKLDTNQWLLNVENGTIDLKTGKLQSHARRNLITKLAPVSFDPKAKCPTWLNFVNQVMGNDVEIISYLQRFCGYALTGVIREHTLTFFHGEGNNGKSTFLKVLFALMGDYACRTSRGLLFRTRSSHERHPTGYADLHGVRFATCSEIGEDEEIDEPLLKDLTGDDPISCRRMREDFWWFIPTHKLFIAGNHKPRIKGTDKGIWRRLHLVPWLVTIPDDDVDTDLGKKLQAEFSGILNWCIAGCLEWQKRGLDPPKAIEAATQMYRKEQDVLGQFFVERLVFEEKGRMGRAKLRQMYEAWCEELGHLPLGARKLAEALRKKHVVDCNIYEGTQTLNGWAGVREITAKDRAQQAWKPEDKSKIKNKGDVDVRPRQNNDRPVGVR